MNLLESLRGRGIKRRLLHPRDEFWDRRLGIRTFGWIPAVGTFGDPDWRGHYQPTPYRDVFATLRHAAVGPGDVFVDLGCGLGRTVFVAGRLGASRCVGVEIDAHLAARCDDNLRHSRRRRGALIEFVCAPAQTYLHRDTTKLFMFHPFGPGIMREVVAQLDEQLDARPRDLTVIYFNPVHQDELARSRHLRLAESWPERMAGRLTTHRYPVSFWRA